MTEFQALAKARAAFYAIVEALGERKAEEIFKRVANEPANAHWSGPGGR